jgi:hypothetical protein
MRLCERVQEYLKHILEASEALPQLTRGPGGPRRGPGGGMAGTVCSRRICMQEALH